MTMLSKREVLAAAAFGTGMVAGARAGRGAASAAQNVPPIPTGRFTAAPASLSAYSAPDWFRDAKFGIWSHWGPQAVPGQGDWYARFMYTPGAPQYAHHLKTYGHPSEVGYKDIIPLWTAEKFDPDALMARYAAAGAKYFVSMGVHHDNFDLWNSRHHRWNAAAMGPKRDIVGAWQKAAKKRGLRFGVSEHLGASYCWWYPNHLYDQFWPKLGVSYDGADPRWADLYHDNRNEPYLNKPGTWYTSNPAFHRIWFDRVRDLVESYQPDLLYSDGGIPFGDYGRTIVAHLYNRSMSARGAPQAVYCCKDSGSGEFIADAVVQDVERGVLDAINPMPWQTDTSNGDWFYKDGDTYKSADTVIALLADIVAKNGNMLLNIVQYPDGSLPPESSALLDDLAAWMAVNGEAIHGTRPWTRFGEGPTRPEPGMFKERVEYTAQDIRFTTRGETLYAIALGEPRGSLDITSLGSGSAHARRPVARVTLPGRPGALSFRQTESMLRISVPANLPTRHAAVFRIEFS